MKSVFIAYDQAFYDQILAILRGNNVRGFSSWQEVQGRGSHTGEPHFGTHAWPSLNGAMLTVVDDDRVDGLLQDLKALDLTSEQMGLRAFVWNVEKMI